MNKKINWREVYKNVAYIIQTACVVYTFDLIKNMLVREIKHRLEIEDTSKK